MNLNEVKKAITNRFPDAVVEKIEFEDSHYIKATANGYTVRSIGFDNNIEVYSDALAKQLADKLHFATKDKKRQTK